MAGESSLSFGVHLPQAGPAASGEAMRRAAVLAEQLGFADVWLSDHVVVPSDAKYPPSAYVFEPLAAMAWVAAATARVRIGTTILVLSMRNPLIVAKTLASIDRMSGGRVILGAAAGWLRAEFDALGVPFEQRGARMDEGLEILRRAWSDDPIDGEFPVHGARFVNIRSKPQPAARIPIWIGGHAPVALARAIRAGDGWHGAFLTPEETAKRVAVLRAKRPEASFTISMRTRWDALVDNPDAILRELEAYREAGVQHFVSEPRQRTLDDYLRSIEALAALCTRAGIAGGR